MEGVRVQCQQFGTHRISMTKIGTNVKLRVVYGNCIRSETKCFFDRTGYHRILAETKYEARWMADDLGSAQGQSAGNFGEYPVKAYHDADFYSIYFPCL